MLLARFSKKRVVACSSICISVGLTLLAIIMTNETGSLTCHSAGIEVLRSILLSAPFGGDPGGESASKLQNHTANGTAIHTKQSNLPPCTDSHKFEPFVKVKGCVKKADVASTTEMITDMNLKGGIRVFPRNGFLLGIVRHGGFLPNEGIDADLGIMCEDISVKTSKFVVQGIVHTYTVTKNPPGKWATFNGSDPWSKRKYDVESITILRTDGTSFSAYCFYPYGPDESFAQVFYPYYTVAGYNHEGSMKEERTWKQRGSSLTVLGRGNEEKSIGEYAGLLNLGNIFDKQVFENLERLKFYDTSIFVPAGYEDILQGFYGTTWREMEKRKDWESLRVENVECLLQPLPIC